MFHVQMMKGKGSRSSPIVFRRETALLQFKLFGGVKPMVVQPLHIGYHCISSQQDLGMLHRVQLYICRHLVGFLLQILMRYVAPMRFSWIFYVFMFIHQLKSALTF